MKRILVTLAVFCFFNLAHAGVNVNNGNFYIAYTDFLINTSGINIDITRTYNSRSAYVKGYFGVGWSSELEGYLKISDNEILYYEGGGGNIVTFAKQNTKLWTNGVYGPQKIELVEEKQKLDLTDMIKSKITGQADPASKKYVLSSVNGKIYTFNNIGALEKIADINKNYINFEYKSGLLSKLKDNFNNQVYVEWQDFGGFPRVVTISKDELKSRYTYSAQGDLLKTKGMDGTPFDYAYDDEHNLTKITYGNGAYKEMAYNKVRDWITSFRDIDSVVTSYSYYSDGLDPENKFGTTVVRKVPGESKLDTARFWYEFRRRTDGSRYNYRTVSMINSLVSETVYTACCGSPLTIAQWNSDAEKLSKDSDTSWTSFSGTKYVTKFDYYESGMLRKKTTPDGINIELTYDPNSKKVASVMQGDRKLEYKYDTSQNLATATDYALSKRMDFVYDLQGRITVIKEKGLKTAGERTLYFRYNNEGRAVEVKEKNVDGSQGSIKIAYDVNGQVSEILNASGRGVASDKEIATTQRIYDTFQHLLDIVKPAGVTLGPEGAI